MPLSARIKKHIDDARASYWLIPTVLVLSAILLAFGSLKFDSHPDLAKYWPDWFNDLTSAEGARAVMSVIAQSVIGVAGVMFSITMLAVSYASGQFGPRLIGNFMRDRGNQWTLGILISTFTFALLVLRAIENASSEMAGFISNLSISSAMGMAIVSVFVMIYHVHHVPETISVSNITAELGRRFVADIEMLLENEATQTKVPTDTSSVNLKLRTPGYIHNIAHNQLSEVACKLGWTIEILEPPGEFMRPHRPVLRIWGTSKLDDGMAERLREAVVLGPARPKRRTWF